MPERQKTAIVTGASSGIGAATSRALAAAGWKVIVGARRIDRLRDLASEIGGLALALDVTDPASVDAFVERVRESEGDLRLLVNNAGGALGIERVQDSTDRTWQTMYETNVLGAVRVTRSLLPALVASGDGHLIFLGSISGFETYPGGSGYTASKHALRALRHTLRLELLGAPVRVTEISPGLVETEFSLVRFGGDRDRASEVYRGMIPLVAEDVADCVAWAASRPAHVNIDEIVVRPRDQATSTAVHRRGDGS